MKHIAVEIGNETWSYFVQETWTHIFNGDGERVICLRWVVTDKEVIRAAAYGFGAGKAQGNIEGKIEKLTEIRKALDL